MNILSKGLPYQTPILFIPSTSSPLPTTSAPTTFAQIAEWKVAVNAKVDSLELVMTTNFSRLVSRLDFLFYLFLMVFLSYFSDFISCIHSLRGRCRVREMLASFLPKGVDGQGLPPGSPVTSSGG